MRHLSFGLSCIAATALVLPAAPATAGDGDLDPTFGDGGIVVTNLSAEGPTSESVGGVAIQDDGKIVVVGSAESADGVDLAVLRHNLDGSLDATFGPDGSGKVTTDFGGNEQAYAVAIDADDNVVVAGHRNGHPLLVRYDSNGLLDLDFGGNQSGAELPFYGGRGYDIAFQANGKILVAWGDAGGSLKVSRFDGSGLPDPSFDQDGTKVVSFAEGNSHAFSVAVAPDGKIVAGGEVWTTWLYRDLALVRLNGDGTPDESFGPDGNGRVTHDFGSHFDRVLDLAVDPDGYIVVAGTRRNTSATEAMVVRFTEDGDPDPAFAEGEPIFPWIGQAVGVSIMTDGGIMVGGNTQLGYSSPDNGWTLARLSDDGTVEWVETTPMTITNLNYYDLAARESQVAIHPDWGIAQAGEGNSYFPNHSDFVVARYGPSGALVTDFGDGGLAVSTFVGDTRDEASDIVAMQPDGKIVVVGTATANYPYIAAARYLPDGSLDGTFADGGVFVSDFDDELGHGRAVAIQADGKILIAGDSRPWGEDQDIALLRLDLDGTRDVSLDFVAPEYDEWSSATHVAVVTTNGEPRILLLGTAGRAPAWNFKLARYLLDGTPDTAFGDGGLIDHESSGGQGAADPRLAMGPGGRIVVAGSQWVAGIGIQGVIRVFDADGAPDDEFDDDGVLEIDLDALASAQYQFEQVAGVAADPDGRILLAASARKGLEPYSFAIVGVLPNGEVDTSFGSGGVWAERFGQFDGGRLKATNVTLQPDGKILVVGRTGVHDGGANFAIARYLPDGTPDPQFDGDGLVITDVGGYETYATVALDAEGRILLAGRTKLPDSTTGIDVVVCRYENDVILDTDGDGILDPDDACADSDLHETIVIDGDDTGVENELLGNGCSLADLIAEILADDPATVDVVQFLVELKAEGLITGQEMGAILQSMNGP